MWIRTISMEQSDWLRVGSRPPPRIVSRCGRTRVLVSSSDSRRTAPPSRCSLFCRNEDHDRARRIFSRATSHGRRNREGVVCSRTGICPTWPRDRADLAGYFKVPATREDRWSRAHPCARLRLAALTDLVESARSDLHASRLVCLTCGRHHRHKHVLASTLVARQE